MDYFSCGKILREYDNGAGDRYLTTNHERDKETGLDYRGARYYDSDVARFLSTDPWADKYPSWSTYNYVMGNPIILTDPTGKGADWIPQVKNNSLILVKEKGDNAQTLAKFLGVSQKVADGLYNNRCENGSVDLSNTTANIPGLKQITDAIADYKLHPDNYGPYERNYDCHESTISIATDNYINKDNVVEGYELKNEIESGAYTDVTNDKSQYRFGHTIIRLGNESGRTMHSATYLGTSKDGTIYTWSKNGSGYKPQVYTLKLLEKYYNAKPQGFSAEPGGGFYNHF